MRVATFVQNQGNRKRSTNNTSGYKGVSQHRVERWVARIGDVPIHNLGTFDEALSAAKAYDAAAIALYGEFALTNKQLGLY